MSKFSEVTRNALNSINSGSKSLKDLRKDVHDLSTKINEQQNIIQQQLDLLQDIRWEARENRKYQEVLRLSATRKVCDDVESFTNERQLGLLETVNLLASTNMSFARFGDGEFRQLLRSNYNLRFQKNSAGLQQAIRDVLLADTDDLLLGFPAVYRDLHGSGVWSDIWYQLEPLVRPITRFGNSHVSRPLYFQQTGQTGVEAWRNVWAGLDICVVTGRNSRFELIPALFSSAASTRRVDSEPVNAFEDIDRLLDSRALPESDLFLISLGPAGTVLSKELAQRGQRALDIGHISDSYLNVFEGGAWPESKKVTRK